MGCQSTAYDTLGKKISEMQITIRRAQSEEADILTNLSMRSKQSNGYDDTLMAAFRDELIITKELLINYECWVAESGLVCGFIILRKEANNTGEVYALLLNLNGNVRGLENCCGVNCRNTPKQKVLHPYILTLIHLQFHFMKQWVSKQ